MIVSTHPRTRKRIEADGHDVRSARAADSSRSGFHRLRAAADSTPRAVLSDSGTISEESSILNFPALNLREAHERPEGMEEAAVMMSGVRAERVLQGLGWPAAAPRRAACAAPGRRLRMPNVSDKVVRILHSYTDYVRRTVYGESLV